MHSTGQRAAHAEYMGWRYRVLIVCAGYITIYSINSTGWTIIASQMYITIKNERRITMGKLKIFETILKAASLLVAAAMAVVKFIGTIGKLSPAKA